MKSQRLKWTRSRGIPPWLFSAGAGVQISGDSGSGKSNALEVILHRLSQVRDAGLLFIDPHGESAKKLYRMILASGASTAGTHAFDVALTDRAYASAGVDHGPQGSGAQRK